VEFTIKATDYINPETVLRRTVIVLNEPDVCADHEEYTSAVVLSSSLLRRIDAREKKINSSLWWRDALTYSRDVVSLVFAGYTGKELNEDGFNGQTGLTGGAAAAWFFFSEKIPGLASAENARTQRSALEATRADIRRQVTQYVSDFRSVERRAAPGFIENTNRIRAATLDAEQRHSGDQLDARLIVNQADAVSTFGSHLRAPASCTPNPSE
jgi:hypothetical protein